MKPKSLVYTCSDTHIYSNHVDAIHDQLQRQPTVTPKLWVNPLIKDKDFSQMTLEDFDVVGYYPEPAIRMQMAV
jgi:thymidylate synthase